MKNAILRIKMRFFVVEKEMEVDPRSSVESGPLLRLFLVRHGQAETNLVHAVGRNNQSPLTPLGITADCSPFFFTYPLPFD